MLIWRPYSVQCMWWQLLVLIIINTSWQMYLASDFVKNCFTHFAKESYKEILSCDFINWLINVLYTGLARWVIMLLDLSQRWLFGFWRAVYIIPSVQGPTSHSMHLLWRQHRPIEFWKAPILWHMNHCTSSVNGLTTVGCSLEISRCFWLALFALCLKKSSCLLVIFFS